MLVLKLVKEDMTTTNGFKWPESGPVNCPDWDPKPECGRGLHGWANGEGAYVHTFNEGKWLVVDVDDENIVDLGDKVKFSHGEVVFCGSRVDAVTFLQKTGALGPESNPSTVTLTPKECAIWAKWCADRVATCAAADAADAADAANYAAAIAANYAANYAERELQRLDKLRLISMR